MEDGRKMPPKKAVPKRATRATTRNKGNEKAVQEKIASELEDLSQLDLTSATNETAKSETPLEKKRGAKSQRESARKRMQAKDQEEEVDEATLSELLDSPAVIVPKVTKKSSPKKAGRKRDSGSLLGDTEREPVEQEQELGREQEGASLSQETVPVVENTQKDVATEPLAKRRRSPAAASAAAVSQTQATQAVFDDTLDATAATSVVSSPAVGDSRVEEGAATTTMHVLSPTAATAPAASFASSAGAAVEAAASAAGTQVEAGGAALPSGPQKRLMITEMLLENFKSYAGVQAVGPFHSRFSSIVGPNGSGKSNVIDGLLFVFGKRAKDMRHSKVSDLIHRSAKFPDLKYCRVEVRFQEIIDHEDDDGFDIVPDSAFSVARKAFHQELKKTPIYQMNGKGASFTEVETMLKSKGIGLDHNRFLILQGDVEQISLMKPKGTGGSDEGLLEYIEDIIGTSVYVQPIAEKAQELMEVSEQRQHRVARLRVVDQELKRCEGPKNTGEERLAEEGRVIDSRAQIAQLQRARNDRDAIKLALELEQLSTQLNTEEERGTADRDRLNELEQQIDDAQKLFDKADVEYTASKKAFAEQDRQFTQLEQDEIHAQKDIVSLKTNASREQQKCADKKKQTADLETQMLRIENETLPALEIEHASAEKGLEKIFAGLRAETEGFQAQLKDKQEQLAPLAKTADDAAAAAALAKSEVDLACEEHEENLRQLSEAEELLRGCTTELPDKQRRHGECTDSVAVLEADLREALNRIEDCKARAPELEANYRKAVLDEQLARATMEDAERALSDRSTTTSKNSIAAKLLRAQEKKHLTGIVGRLGDLASVPAHLDVAVSTAAAGTLNNIVVNTMAEAEACVEFCRKNKFGVVTCLVVERQEHLRKSAAEHFSCPQNAQRLFDQLCILEQRLAGCFYFAFRDTLVCTTIEHAKQAAFGGNARRRVVTTDGKLIETSGTMSGGGRPISGLMALSGDAASSSAEQSSEALQREVARAKMAHEKCESLVKSTKSKLETNVQFLAQAEERAANSTRELGELKSEATKLQMDLETAGQRAEEITVRLPALRERCQLSPEEEDQISELRAKLVENERIAADAKARADVLQKQCAALLTQISAVGGERVKEAKEKVETLSKRISAAGKEKARLSASKKGAQRAVDEAVKKEQKLLEQIEASEKKLALIKEQKEKLIEDSLQIKDAQETLYAARKATGKDLKHKQKHFRELKDIVDEFYSKQAQLKITVDECRERQQRAEASVKQLDATLQQFAELKRDCHVPTEDLVDAASNVAASIVAVGDPAAISSEAADEVKAPVRNDSAALVLLGKAELSEMLDGDSDHVDKALKALQVARAQHEALLERLGDKTEAVRAIRAWRDAKKNWDAKRAELDEITLRRDAIGRDHETLRKKRFTEFMDGFEQITTQLKKMYQMITLGGDAELDLVDTMDPFSEGIMFSVRPPKKSWKNIANLSGGEKTLSSLALVFALHYYRPTPLYVMDEIDAALDFRNVSIVANYIKERTRNAQFVIISLRNYMFELADRLVGVYKLSNCSRSVAITPSEFAIPTSAGASSMANKDARDKENSGPLDSQ